jgi:alpha-tubulin suppressor-like RCC1 family protein
MLQFDQIYTDSLVFYEALDLYNEKDYNKSYYMFGKVTEENIYYEKSVTYISKIYENIMVLLNKDIVKIEKDISTLSDEEQLNIYILIEETILEYNNVYNVNLSEYDKYQEVLSLYTSKVSQYTDIVYGN